MVDDLLSVSPSAERDPDGSKLHAALTAQLACERLQQTRSMRAHLLAVLGLPVWILGAWPGCLSGGPRRAVLVAWALCALAAASAAIAEWRQRTRRDLNVLQLRGGPPPDA